MAVQSAGSVQGSVNQVVDLKGRSLKDKVSLSIQKKRSDIRLDIQKNLINNQGTPNKGSKIDVFA